MILLDTNVISEIMRIAPNDSVLQWLNTSKSTHLYLSQITIAEITYGLRIMPDGRRRGAMKNRFEQFVDRGFSQRVLGFDMQAASCYGDIMGFRKELGRPVSVLDGQIAAIARARNFTVATRNVADFEDCGVELINPWESA